MTDDHCAGLSSTHPASLATNKSGVAKQTLPVQVKKKKKVADSWDDDADEEDFQAELEAKKEKKRLETEALAAEKPAWEEGAGLLNVLKAFKLLKADFDTKFRAMWA